MKKLKKVKLKNFKEMTQSEMKNVIGGNYDDYPCASGGRLFKCTLSYNGGSVSTSTFCVNGSEGDAVSQMYSGYVQNYPEWSNNWTNLNVSCHEER